MDWFWQMDWYDWLHWNGKEEKNLAGGARVPFLCDVLNSFACVYADHALYHVKNHHKKVLAVLPVAHLVLRCQDAGFLFFGPIPSRLLYPLKNVRECSTKENEGRNGSFHVANGQGSEVVFCQLVADLGRKY